jgi:Cu+-exporting ATPase
MNRVVQTEKIVENKLYCYHCGDECKNDSISINDKYFCCNGCKTVYEIFNANDLCDYYDLNASPGESRRDDIHRNLDFLDDADLKNRLLDFTDGKISKITFDIPQIHCSSCIWILEQLYKLDNSILQSQVDFLKKKVSVKYNEELTNLKNVVHLLDSIGYLPNLNLAEKETDKEKKEIKKLYYRIGVAGFSFGNIMLLSFPEYLSFQDSVTQDIKSIFNFLIVALSMPVIFYCASPYYISAWKGLRKKIVNIDVPITLGILVLFLRSMYELITVTGPGYLDSLSGLVFFLLIGKLFQNKTYSALNFERNYKSYFPISVTTLSDGIETTIPVDKLEKGRRIVVKNNELIPADSILISEGANIDYSFVTGESTLRKCDRT